MSADPNRQKFRPARVDDTDHIVNLLIPLFQKVGVIYGIKPDAESIIASVLHTIERGVCLVGDHACAGGFIRNYPWNYNAKLGVILFWNYDRPSGIKILPEMVEAFRRLGATHINCASHFPDNRIGKHYEALGIHPAEVQYVGNILQGEGLGFNNGKAEMKRHSDTPQPPEGLCQH